jgi:hypothetical protein
MTASRDKIGLPRTHFDIQKFGKADEDENYQTLREALKIMCEKGPGIIAERRSATPKQSANRG